MSGAAGQAVGSDRPPGGVDQADWARLPDEVRRRIRSAAIDQYPPEQQDAIRAYLRRLAEEDR